MDFTNIKCLGANCKDRDIKMHGAGASVGGRVTSVKVKCPECGLLLLIVPMSDKYEYCISATTEEERKEQRVRKAIADSELDLAKTITRIRETGY